MIDTLTSTPFFGLGVTLLCWYLAVRFQKRTGLLICNPVLVASLLVIGIMLLFHIPLDNYNAGGSIIKLLLAPATAVLALNIYQQRAILKRNFWPVVLGCFVGSLVSVLAVLLLGGGVALGLRFYSGIARDPMRAFTEPSPSPSPLQAGQPLPSPTLTPEEQLLRQADTDFMRSRVNILLVGWDQSPERDDSDSVMYRDSKNNFRSDVLMLLAVDFEQGNAHLISIPRDTMAKIYNTKGHYKINAAFAKGGSAEGDGFEYAIKTVENLMGVPISHYVGVNMEGLKAVVNALGGVEYDVDREIKLNGRVLHKGVQRLDGQQVLDYCRARKGYGTDVDRADRQQRMLFAIFTQLREGSRLTSIPKLYLSVKDYIYTDLTAEQIAALAVFGMDLVPGESLVRHTLKGKYISGTAYNGASFYVLDTRALKSLMKDIFGVDIKVDYRYDYRYIQDKKS